MGKIQVLDQVTIDKIAAGEGASGFRGERAGRKRD